MLSPKWWCGMAIPWSVVFHFFEWGLKTLFFFSNVEDAINISGKGSTPATRIATVAWMIIFGDGIHNFIDGIRLGRLFTTGLRRRFEPRTTLVYNQKNCILEKICLKNANIGVRLLNTGVALLAAWKSASILRLFWLQSQLANQTNILNNYSFSARHNWFNWFLRWEFMKKNPRK